MNKQSAFPRFFVHCKKYSPHGQMPFYINLHQLSNSIFTIAYLSVGFAACVRNRRVVEWREKPRQVRGSAAATTAFYHPCVTAARSRINLKIQPETK